MARNVSVTLSANVGGFVGAMGRAGAAVDSVTSKMAKSARDNSQQWDTVGSTLTRVGAVAAAGLGFAAKAAMDWESAFAGVKKTVDGTPQQIAALEGELRGMARTMATSHTEIASVAEAAGALGVATEDVAGFTKTMIMLGESTNLSATEAADSLAQFMNVMGTAPDQVGNLGAALVALGNDGASTERQIVQMSQRIAGAGRQIGLSEADVMGFASALSSVGIEVEAGGTAISTTMLKMEQAVRNGGRELDLIAQTAGMSAAQFKTAFQQDAAGAIDAFVQGLGRVQAAGGDVTGILSELGITGIREADALRRLASSGTLLADSLATARTEMRTGQALLAEYGARANTTEFQVRVAWNNIKDSAITAGQAMLPAIEAAAKGVASFAQALGNMGPGAQRFATVALAIVAAVGLLGGAAIKAVAGIVELSAALKALGAASAISGTMSTLGAGLAAAARAAAPLAIALAAVAVTARALNQSLKEGDAGYQMTRNLQNVEQAIRAVSDATARGPFNLDEMFRFETGALIKERVTGLDDAMRQINQTGAYPAFAQWAHDLGLATSTVGEAKDRFLELDTAMSGMTKNGQMQTAAAAFDQIAQAAARQKVPTEQLIGLFPQYAEAVRNAGEAIKGQALSADEMVELMSGRIPASMREAAAANSQLSNELAKLTGQAQAATMSMQEYANSLLALSGSQIGVEQAIANANEALAENGRNIDLTTEAGRANVTALNQLAQASMSYVQTLADQGASQEEQVKAVARARGEYERLARAMGYSEADVRKMADAFFATVAPNEQAAAAARNFSVEVAALTTALSAVPADKKVTLKADGMKDVETNVAGIADALKGLPPEKVVTVTLPNGQVVTGTVKDIQAALQALPDKNVKLSADDQATAKVQGLAGALALMPEYKNIVVTMPNGQQVHTTADNLAKSIQGVPDNKTITLTMPGGQQVQVTAGEVRAALGMVPDSKNISLTAQADGVQAATMLANGLLAMLPAEKRTALTGDSTGLAGAAMLANSLLQMIPPEKRTVITGDNAGLAGAALLSQALIAAIPANKNTTITADNAGLVGAAMLSQALIAAIPNKTAIINADPSGAVGGASRATGAIMAVPNKTALINANPAGAVAGSARATAAVSSVPNRTVSINGNAGGAVGAAAAARGAIASVTGKTVFITAVFRTVGSPPSAAADGGLISPHIAPAPAEFAGAQRLSVGGPVRGWSPHPRADNVPAWLTAGEIVQSNAAGDLYGRDRLLALNARRVDPAAFAAFMSAQGLADGGIAKAKESFTRPAPQPTMRAAASTVEPPSVQQITNQEYNIWYPVNERMSQATRRAASRAAVEAQL